MAPLLHSTKISWKVFILLQKEFKFHVNVILHTFIFTIKSFNTSSSHKLSEIKHKINEIISRFHFQLIVLMTHTPFSLRFAIRHSLLFQSNLSRRSTLFPRSRLRLLLYFYWQDFMYSYNMATVSWKVTLATETGKPITEIKTRLEVGRRWVTLMGKKRNRPNWRSHGWSFGMATWKRRG